MKILTINCQRSYHKDALVDFLTKVINQGEYDAIFLQELPQDIVPVVNTLHSYNLVSDRNVVGPNGRVAVLVRKDNEILNTDYCLFERQKAGAKEYFYEMISVVIRTGDNRKYILSSLHMTAYLHILRRIHHLQKILWRLNILRRQNNKDAVIACGGDWNAVFPYEKYILKLLLNARFKFIFPKRDTYFTDKIEPGLFLNNLVKNVASIFKINLIIDFFLISRNVKGVIEVISADVSDHNPVSLYIRD